MLSQMVSLYQRFGCALSLSRKCLGKRPQDGVIAGEEEEPGIIRISDMVEKPAPEDAPSNLAIIGRYVLTPEIFDILDDTAPGKNGEIQITDALLTQAQRGNVIGYKFQTRFDCGSVGGFIDATNYTLQKCKVSSREHEWHHDNRITCFKAYDIRGRVPDRNEDIAYRIGRAYAALLSRAGSRRLRYSSDQRGALHCRQPRADGRTS